jgi:predicted transglutaminase-like cysteine proteinase
MRRVQLFSISTFAALLFAATGSFAAQDISTPSGGRDDVIGAEMTRFNGAIVPQWRSFTSRRGNVSGAWSTFVNSLRAGGDGRGLLDRVNAAVNQVPYVSDASIGRPVNYWATPSEFLARGGDCKDYALAKYTALRALGVPAGAMRILVVPEHAVLVVSTKDGPIVLDNLRSSPYPLDQGLTSRAVYAVSDAGAWIKVIRN